MVWHLIIRAPVVSIDNVVESQDMAVKLIECLKRVFPERDGTESGRILGKCNDVLHVAQIIALFGWTQNTSDNWGKNDHSKLLKCLVGLTNNNSIFRQIAQWHHKEGLLQRELDSGQALASGSDSQSQGSKADQAACELAVKYRLLHAAVHVKDLQYSKESLGKHGKGRYRLDVWSLPADRVPQLSLVKQHPILKELPTALGVFAYDFLQKQMGLKFLESGRSSKCCTGKRCAGQLYARPNAVHIWLS
jgi:hypothetical protein